MQNTILKRNTGCSESVKKTMSMLRVLSVNIVLYLLVVTDALHDQNESLRLDGRKNILINENSLGQSRGELKKKGNTVDSEDKTNDKKEESWQPLNVKRFKVGKRGPCEVVCPSSWGGPWYPPNGFGGGCGCGGSCGCGCGGSCGCNKDVWCRKLFFILMKQS